jgi:hypothetical protein
LLRAPGFRREELGTERIGEPRDDLVLHVEEVGDGLVEPFRPEMGAALGVNELDIDPHPATRALNTALEHVANVQFAADPFHIAASALVVEGGVARDHEGARNAREIGGQALGDAIDEIVLLRVAGQVGQGQDDDGKTRRFPPTPTSAIAIRTDL